MTDQVATQAGYTAEFYCDLGSNEAHILTRPDTDMDSRFKAWDCGEQEFIMINGWMCTFDHVFECLKCRGLGQFNVWYDPIEPDLVDCFECNQSGEVDQATAIKQRETHALACAEKHNAPSFYKPPCEWDWNRIVEHRV